MDKDTALAFSKGCFRGQPAPCSGACPFHMDIRGFAEKMKSGRFSSAYRQLRSDLVFPETVSLLCAPPVRITVRVVFWTRACGSMIWKPPVFWERRKRRHRLIVFRRVRKTSP